MPKVGNSQKSQSTLEVDENLMAALSYLLFFISGIIFLILEKKNQFVRFHAMQSTLFFGFIFLAIFGFSFLPEVTSSIINAILWVAAIIIWVVVMVKAYAGKKYKLPYFGKLAEDQLKKLQ